MMSMDCIMWLEDEGGRNEVEWSSGRKTEGTQQKNSLHETVERNRKNLLYKKVGKITLKLILFFCIKPFCKFHGLKPILFFVFVKSLWLSLFKVQLILHAIVDFYRYCNSVFKQTWFLLERKGSRTKGYSTN